MNPCDDGFGPHPITPELINFLEQRSKEGDQHARLTYLSLKVSETLKNELDNKINDNHPIEHVIFYVILHCLKTYCRTFNVSNDDFKKIMQIAVDEYREA